MKTIFLSTALLFTTMTLSAQTYALDKSHAKLGFSITHMMVSEVEGQFKTFDITLNSSKEDLSDAKIELSADINSIDTDNDQRDMHLKSPDFFDAATYGKLTFKSTSYKKDAKEKLKYILTGDLTMHGITKSITIEVTYNGSVENPMTKKMVLGFKIKGKLKRSDFGIGASMPTSMLGDEVNLSSNIEFIKN